jgi:hypothetical protein
LWLATVSDDESWFGLGAIIDGGKGLGLISCRGGTGECKIEVIGGRGDPFFSFTISINLEKKGKRINKNSF